ncbi:hypothetical protein E2986_11443 [Frieseomelitta varia]|uniref:Uncharacterized protein n=1 Tax=Frieseomelitta varia TaxID=561572 RepID=A0A833VPA9_9HYME|nr:hypothetical protein E2986_11443 [Frieseomelitta varia]
MPFISYLGNDIACLLLKFSNHLFDYPEVRKLYNDNNSKEKFDLKNKSLAFIVVLSNFLWPATVSETPNYRLKMLHFCNTYYNYRIIYKIKNINRRIMFCIILGLSSFGLTTIDIHMLGGLVMASHEATWKMEFNVGSELPFWKRLKNFCIMWYLIYTIHRHFYPLDQKIAEEHIGMPLPPMIDIAKSQSCFENERIYGIMKRIILFHICSETIVGYMIEILQYTSSLIFNIFPKILNNLLQILRTCIVDNFNDRLTINFENIILRMSYKTATDGFIYFSVGTTARLSDIPDDIQQIFYDVFAKLPYKIVWKNEGKLLRKSDIIYVSSWYPQSSILVL